VIPTYFELYGLPETFLPDPAALRAAYHRISRETHPDFFATATPAEQQQALELATRNTDAYRTLSDYDRRLEYLLRHHGMLAEGETPSLPPAFLGEMMELNEEIMELEFDPDPAAIQRVLTATESRANALEASIQPTLLAYPSLPPPERPAALRQVLDYYLRRRYMLRIREQVAKFAPRS
jgi:molecular chaperone HscB